MLKQGQRKTDITSFQITDAVRHFPNVVLEIENGRLWRAREILEGRISNGYDQTTCLALGQLLWHLGDGKRAGMHLLLGGCKDESLSEPISIFLTRVRANSFSGLMSQLPGQARWRTLEEYPAGLREALSARNYVNSYARSREKPAKAQIVENSLGEKIGCSFAIAMALLFLFSAVYGIYRFIADGPFSSGP